VTAKQYGEGRIVVVGDQNMFGDSWLHWGSNFELAVNSFDWLAKQEASERPLRSIKPRGVNIGHYQPAIEYRAGSRSPDSYFSLYVNANRDLSVTASGNEVLDQRDDVMILTDVSNEMSETEIDSLRQYLRDGKKVVITFEADELRAETIELLKAIVPDFSLEVAGTDYGIDGDIETLTGLEVPRKDGTFPGTSDFIMINGLQIASFEGANSDPYLLDVRSKWGRPFLQAGGTDLARIGNVDGGELIIFIQDGFLRNRTLGDYLRVPNIEGVVQPEGASAASGFNDAHLLHFRLLDWFKSENGIE
jgi:hypothetical protein